MAVPVFHLEAAFGSYPGDASYSWTDISTRGISTTYSRGRSYELDQAQAGQGQTVLNDQDRAFDSNYSSSPYYPDVIPMVPLRGYAVIAATTYYQFQHYVTSWTRQRMGPNWAKRTIRSVDGFELLQKPLQPVKATGTTALGSNRDITYTAVDAGLDGNRITVRYLNTKPFSVGVSSHALIVYTGASGVTANQIISAIQAHTEAFRLVTPALAVGSDGTGTVTSMAEMRLSGGAPRSFAAGLSGTQITSALDAVGWPSALRVLAAGKRTIRARTFQPGDSVACLDYLQQVAGAGGEEGFLFIDGQGRVIFLDSWSQYQTPYTTSQVTFTDTVGGGVVYQELTPSYDKELIVNEWTGTRTGGKTMIVTDLVSQAKYLRRPKEISSVLGDNDQLIGVLQMRLAKYKDPLDRVESIKVMPGSDTTAWQACLAREPGDRVTVVQHPPGGGTDSREYFVQQIQADIDYASPVKSAFTFRLWPADVGNWLILDDSVYGKLDSNRVGV